MTYRSRLKAWRQGKSLSQADLAYLLHVTQAAVSKYEQPLGSKTHSRPNSFVSEILLELSDGEINAANYADDVSADSAEQVALNTAMSPQSGAPSQGEADAGSKQS